MGLPLDILRELYSYCGRDKQEFLVTVLDFLRLENANNVMGEEGCEGHDEVFPLGTIEYDGSILKIGFVDRGLVYED